VAVQVSIPLTEIHYDEDFNCRGRIAPIDVIDLAKDIRQRGQLQAVLLSPYNEEEQKRIGFKYRLIAGYRRFTAHEVLSQGRDGDPRFSSIDCVIRDDMRDEAEARFLNLAENIQRQDLNIVQEAKALSKLEELGISEVDAAERLGKSRGWVQVRYMLLRMPEDVQNEVRAGMVTQTDIRDLYSIFTTAGEGATRTAVKDLKQAKQSGRKGARVKSPKKKKPTKRHRKRGELFEMQDHIREQFGNGTMTVLLAWAAGEVGDSDLHTALKQEASDLDIPYKMPIE
jgi:ParB family transcriptional regulator, chromosome partitioning protein